MEIVMLTALGVGGATIFGALVGFLFEGISNRFKYATTAFAAGIMLSAAVIGLIIPSFEGGGSFAILITSLGIVLGAVCIHLIDAAVPRIMHFSKGERTESSSRAILFVVAIAIHNLPEGIAAGVAFGTDNVTGALLCALGIALQNIPEGLVLIAPMLNAGISRTRAFVYASLTGVVEIIGTLIGYFAVMQASGILPFTLAFAGGTMLYVISDEMIPDAHIHGDSRASTFSFIFGFCFMLVFGELLSAILVS